MKESIWEKILDKTLPLRERSFRAILIIGVITSFFTVIEGFALNTSSASNLILLFLLAVLLVALFLTFKLNKIKISMYLVGLALVVVILPFTYIFCGGSAGGAGIWLTMGMAYAFIFFTGKSLVFFSVLAVIVNGITVYVGYRFPEFIYPIDTVEYTHFDIFFSAILVGLFFGSILKFQSKVYDQERLLVLKQKEELEKVNDAKIRFFSNMSKELRQPINNILELNELVMREKISDDGIENLTQINYQSKYLLSFVNDIFDCARLEGNKVVLEKEEYDTISLITGIVDRISNQAKQKNIEFIVKVDSRLPKSLIGDARRIEQIFMNLLINSLQSTQKGSITFEVGCSDLGTEWTSLNIKVADTGTGVRKDDIPFLFDSFRPDYKDSELSLEGSGIGLTICKQLVELMDGEITVDSIYTKGTTFTVKIEQEVANSEEIGALNNYRKKESGKNIYRHSFESPEAKILVIDSNEMNLMIFQKLLRETKVQIDTCSSALESLNMTYNKYYNLIFVDYMMPEINGVEILSRIRKQENGMNKDTPVIAIVTDELRGGEKMYLELGFSSFIRKPIAGEKLENKILQFLPDDIVEYRRDIAANDSGIIQGHSIIKKKLIITTDVVSDISPELAKNIGVKIFHLYIRTPYGRFCDNTELSTSNYAVFSPEQLSNSTMDSASVEEFEDFFANALTEAEEIIHISLSDSAGKSYNNAIQAAKGFDHVHIMDAGSISCSQGLLVMYAAKLAKVGKNVTEILDELSVVKSKVYSSYVTLNALQMYSMGYTSKMLYDVLHFLGVHPKIRIVGGRPKINGFVSTDERNLYQKFISSEFRNRNNINKSVLFISHAGLSEKELNSLVLSIKKKVPFEKVVICAASATNTCGAGLGTFGFAYFMK